MNYYIIITGEGVLSSKAFLARLRLRWSMACVRASMEFELPMSQQTLHGSLAHGEKGVIIHSGDAHDCAEFIHWCRSLIPSAEAVVFCDDSMAMDCILSPDMSAADIGRIIVSS